MNARTYFKSLSVLVIAISIVIGLGAIFLIERIVPAIDGILQENAYSVNAAVGMLDSISSNVNDINAESNRERFWIEFKKAKDNITIEGEAELIDQIQGLAELYWLERTTNQQQVQLAGTINQLATTNMQAMEVKDKTAQTISLTGAWAIGLLLFLSIGIQFFFRFKTVSALVSPLEELLDILDNFSSGNRQRRCLDSRSSVLEIRKISYLINKLMDEACHLKR